MPGSSVRRTESSTSRSSSVERKALGPGLETAELAAAAGDLGTNLDDDPTPAHRGEP